MPIFFVDATLTTHSVMECFVFHSFCFLLLPELEKVHIPN